MSDVLSFIYLCMNAAHRPCLHSSPTAVLLRAPPARSDLARTLTCNARGTSAPPKPAAAVAQPNLPRDARAARPTQTVSGVRLYEVAVPLAEDPGKVGSMRQSLKVLCAVAASTMLT